MKQFLLILALSALTCNVARAMEALPELDAAVPNVQVLPEGRLALVKRHFNLSNFFCQLGAYLAEDRNAVAQDLTDEQLVTRKTIESFIGALRLEGINHLVFPKKLKTLLQTLNRDYFDPEVSMEENGPAYVEALQAALKADGIKRAFAERASLGSLVTPGSFFGLVAGSVTPFCNENGFTALGDAVLNAKPLAKPLFVDCVNLRPLLVAEGIEAAQIPLYEKALQGVLSCVVDLTRDRNSAAAHLFNSVGLYDAREREAYLREEALRAEEVARRAPAARAVPHDNNAQRPEQPAAPAQQSWFARAGSLFSIGGIRNDAAPAAPVRNNNNAQAAGAAEQEGQPAVAGEPEVQAEQPAPAITIAQINRYVNLSQFFLQLGAFLSEDANEDGDDEDVQQLTEEKAFAKKIADAFIGAIRWGSLQVTIAGHSGTLEEFCNIDQFKLLLKALNADYFGTEQRNNRMVAYMRAFKSSLNRQALVAKIGQTELDALIQKIDAGIAYAEGHPVAPVEELVNIESFLGMIGYSIQSYCNTTALKGLINRFLQRQPLEKTVTLDCFKLQPLFRALGHTGDNAALELLDKAVHAVTSFAFDRARNPQAAEQRMLSCFALYDYEERVAHAWDTISEQEKERVIQGGNVTEALAVRLIADQELYSQLTGIPVQDLRASLARRPRNQAAPGKKESPLHSNN